MIHSIIFLLLFLNSDFDINMVDNLPAVRAFAESLEKEGDWYRAITEYKRYLYLLGKSNDTIIYKIAGSYEKMGKFENALDVLQKIETKNDARYRLNLGRIYFLAGDYMNAKIFWQDNDTLTGWIYLREGQFKAASELLGITDFPVQKSQLLGGILSGIIPGLGRVYAGRWSDGIYSFILTVGTGAYSYYYYKQENHLMAYILGSLGFCFYLGDIYGAIISVRHYNHKKKDDYINGIEIRLGFEKKL